MKLSRRRHRACFPSSDSIGQSSGLPPSSSLNCLTAWYVRVNLLLLGLYVRCASFPFSSNVRCRVDLLYRPVFKALYKLVGWN